jgi:hypothetical protein
MRQQFFPQVSCCSAVVIVAGRLPLSTVFLGTDENPVVFGSGWKELDNAVYYELDTCKYDSYQDHLFEFCLVYSAYNFAANKRAC